MKSKYLPLLVSFVPFTAWLLLLYFNFGLAVVVAFVIGAWYIGSLSFKFGEWFVEKYLK